MEDSVEVLALQPEDTTTRSEEPNLEGKTPQLQETEKVEVFLRRFLESDAYKTGYDKFYQNKTVRDDVGEDLKREVFENSDNGMLAVYDFYQKNCRLRYNPMSYSPEIVTVIKDYIQAIMEFQQEYIAPTPDRDRIINADLKRAATHSKLAETFLRNGIVHTRKQGEFIARIIAVESGIEKSAYLEPQSSSSKARIAVSVNNSRG